MIAWKKQEAVLVGTFTLTDGTRATAVLLAAASHPNSAMLVLPAPESQPVQPRPLTQTLDLLTKEQILDILCTQERAFGDSGLEPVTFS